MSHKKTFILSLVVLSMSMASNEIIDIENKLNNRSRPKDHGRS